MKSLVQRNQFWFGLSVLCIATSMAAAGQSNTDERLIITQGEEWAYFETREMIGTAWREGTFDDSKWKRGKAEFGYGDGNETTVIDFGENAQSKFITTYFRKEFSIADPTVLEHTLLRVLRDDGAVVYLNGQEIHRTQMPAAPAVIQSSTLATYASAGIDESQFEEAYVESPPFIKGKNILAVEIHQSHRATSDMSFDLQLVQWLGGPAITRQPYLQQATPSGITLRWKTRIPCESVVRHGKSPDNLTTTVTVPAPTTDHVVSIGGLTDDERHYYQIGPEGGHPSFTVGGDPEHYFKELPTPGSKMPVQVWALGDSGTADANARRVRDAFLNYNQDVPPDVWLMLGDNAYSVGSATDYQRAVFDTYPTILANTVLWPTLGNHDGMNADSQTLTGPYYDNFTLPSQGESGGLPSGTEAYYAFDYGPVHFVCLDSQDSGRGPNGAMARWLRADLEDTLADWVIAYWHHPPYTKGSHDSDNPRDSAGRLAEMREFIVPILDEFRVDVVLCGHSHSYERSYLLTGHYCPSDTLTDDMILDSGDGRVVGDGAYEKTMSGTGEGTIYAVAGSSGKIGGGPLNHRAIFIGLNELGSVILEIDGDELQGIFLTDLGEVRDTFTIRKEGLAGR